MIDATAEPTEEMFQVNLTPEQSEQFWSHVKKTDTCWLWQGWLKPNGYASTFIRGLHGKWYAHRVSAALRFGAFPKKLFVLHKCDVRNCVNPDHLFLGDHKANFTDAVNKGRMAHGSRHYRTSMNEELVSQALELRAKKLPVREIALQLGVSESAISRAISGETWARVPDPLDVRSVSLRGVNQVKGSEHHNSKLTETIVLQIRGLYPTIKGPELARKFGVETATIYGILNRRSWAHLP